MRLSREEEKILEGKEGDLLQQALTGLLKYGKAMGAEEFVPISSAHTFFFTLRQAAQFFPPHRVRLTDEDVARFGEKLAKVQAKARTTINPGMVDLDRWREIGASRRTAESARQVVDICGRAGILATWTCIPHLTHNIPVIGEHCAWSESSALIYCNSILGARTNREGAEASFFSGLLGITPKYGMHLDANRRGTHLIEVRCDLESTSDWGALGYFAGKMAGDGVPVFTSLRRPTAEEAKQLGASINVPGGSPMFHIVGVTPEAPSVKSALGQDEGGVRKYVFDEAAKARAGVELNNQPEGKVNMVLLGCPHATLDEVQQISRYLAGKKVSTRLWVMTAQSIRAAADRLGFSRIIEAAGGEVIADGCAFAFYDYTDATRPDMTRIATDSVKLALGSRRSFGSKAVFASTRRALQIAVEGGA